VNEKSDIYSDLKQLGQSVSTPSSPEQAELETVANPHPDVDYCVRFTAPEFTSLCPMTGQPDFAHLVIDYVPAEKLVESKSLKLIARRLIQELQPKWLRLGGYWYPRGGIPIDVFFQHGELPAGVWAADQGVPSYRGRG